MIDGPPPAGIGVCRLCKASSNPRGNTPTSTLCSSCALRTAQLGLGTRHPLPLLIPLALAFKDTSPLTWALWRYKNSTGQDAAGAQEQIRNLIDERMPHVYNRHLPDIDLITWVPGRTTGRPNVARLFGGSRWGQGRDAHGVLAVRDFDRATHEADENRFRVVRPVEESSVLLLDDTFTTGASTFSAARALYDAGASKVAIVVVGRRADPDWMPGDYLKTLRERRERGRWCGECNDNVTGLQVAISKVSQDAALRPVPSSSDKRAPVRTSSPATPGEILHPRQPVASASTGSFDLEPTDAPSSNASSDEATKNWWDRVSVAQVRWTVLVLSALAAVVAVIAATNMKPAPCITSNSRAFATQGAQATVEGKVVAVSPSTRSPVFLTLQPRSGPPEVALRMTREVAESASRKVDAYRGEIVCAQGIVDRAGTRMLPPRINVSTGSAISVR